MTFSHRGEKTDAHPCPMSPAPMHATRVMLMTLISFFHSETGLRPFVLFVVEYNDLLTTKDTKIAKISIASKYVIEFMKPGA
jgi:hypothetical protein